MKSRYLKATPVVHFFLVSFYVMFFFVQNLNAQSPVLTKANCSLKVNDQYFFQFCNTASFNVGANGTDLLWNYSTLQDSTVLGIPVLDYELIVDPATTLFGILFPHATTCATHPFNPTKFDYYSNDSAFFYWGTKTDVGLSVYSKAQAALPLYPVSYGVTYIDSSNLLLDTVGYKGTDTLSVVGYGTLKLPDTTYTNVLKIKRSSKHVTSLIAGSQIVVSSVEYIYYAEGIGANILNLQQFSTTTYLFGFPVVTLNTKDIYYLKTLSVLPLQITAFNAALKDHNIQLSWQTAQEINTSYFNILKSTNGKDFTVVGKVDAAGVSNGMKNYVYTDEGAAYSKFTKVYYRLQEVDKDGKSTYSSIQSIDINKVKLLFAASPNPAKDHIDLKATADANDVQVTISDMNGRTLYTAKQSFVAGQAVTIPVAQFSKQVLIISLKSDEVQQQLKVIKE